jgi:hypothetical protein
MGVLSRPAVPVLAVSAVCALIWSAALILPAVLITKLIA